jgi:hypothetical protein
MEDLPVVINGLGVVAAIAGVFRPGEQRQQRIVIRQPFIGRQQAQGIAKLAMADGEVDGQAQVLRIVVQAVGFPSRLSDSGSCSSGWSLSGAVSLVS